MGHELESDLVVVGGTPAGVCAAVAAARMGASVTLVEETTRLGGMLSAGLCHLDKKYFASVSGIIREWCDRNRDYYLRELPDDPVVKAAPVGSDMAVRLGTKFEPHIAENTSGNWWRRRGASEFSIVRGLSRPSRAMRPCVGSWLNVPTASASHSPPASS